MDKDYEIVIEYSDTQADWDAFIELMVDKFKKWQEDKGDDETV